MLFFYIIWDNRKDVLLERFHYTVVLFSEVSISTSLLRVTIMNNSMLLLLFGKEVDECDLAKLILTKRYDLKSREQSSASSTEVARASGRCC